MKENPASSVPTPRFSANSARSVHVPAPFLRPSGSFRLTRKQIPRNHIAQTTAPDGMADVAMGTPALCAGQHSSSGSPAGARCLARSAPHTVRRESVAIRHKRCPLRHTANKPERLHLESAHIDRRHRKPARGSFRKRRDATYIPGHGYSRRALAAHCDTWPANMNTLDQTCYRERKSQ